MSSPREDAAARRATALDEVFGLFPAQRTSFRPRDHPQRGAAADAGDRRALMTRPRALMLDEPSLDWRPSSSDTSLRRSAS